MAHLADAGRSPPSAADVPWHALDASAVAGQLDSPADGLSSMEAAARLRRFGPNRLTPPKRRPAWLRFLAQFHNLLIYVLLASGTVALLLRHWTDAGVIFGVVLVNALIGYIQEDKAEQALEAIRNLLSPQAVVLRDFLRDEADG